MAYNLIFVFLGMGTLFGGLCIHYSNIPPYFIWAYYTSIPAAMSRALIINEYSAYHVSMPCEDLVRYVYEDSGTGIDAFHTKMQDPQFAACKLCTVLACASVFRKTYAVLFVIRLSFVFHP
eukprot:SAG31_NODE_1984_length_6740_cov_4.949255_12_plen_121_part_00